MKMKNEPEKNLITSMFEKATSSLNGCLLTSEGWFQFNWLDQDEGIAKTKPRALCVLDEKADKFYW
jgi:hypothetical protein